jgi:hypothetical protein
VITVRAVDLCRTQTGGLDLDTTDNHHITDNDDATNTREQHGVPTHGGHTGITPTADPRSVPCRSPTPGLAVPQVCIMCPCFCRSFRPRRKLVGVQIPAGAGDGLDPTTVSPPCAPSPTVRVHAAICAVRVIASAR